jgi:hypothetical protein
MCVCECASVCVCARVCCKQRTHVELSDETCKIRVLEVFRKFLFSELLSVRHDKRLSPRSPPDEVVVRLVLDHRCDAMVRHAVRRDVCENGCGCVWRLGVRRRVCESVS